MARKKSRTAKKGVTPQKVHCKRAGFNAFGAQTSTVRRAVKLAKCKIVDPPETGIHSLAWANSIAPQDSGLLKLPVEIRCRIWILALQNLGPDVVAPTKKGNIFHSENWPNAAQDTAALPETCRQIYVDVVGGGLLYKAKTFLFSPGLMLNYLWVINPVHRNSVRSIRLEIRVGRKFSPPKKALLMLGELQGLQKLYLVFKIERTLCLPINYRPGLSSFTASHPTLIHNGRYVPSAELSTIRRCQELRDIHVQSLSLEFVFGDWMPSWLNFHQYNGTPLSAAGDGPYYDLKKELMEAMVVKDSIWMG